MFGAGAIAVVANLLAREGDVELAATVEVEQLDVHHHHDIRRLGGPLRLGRLKLEAQLAPRESPAKASPPPSLHEAGRGEHFTYRFMSMGSCEVGAFLGSLGSFGLSLPEPLLSYVRRRSSSDSTSYASAIFIKTSSAPSSLFLSG